MINKAEYRAYHDAKSRCNNKNHPRFHDWGGRGIQFLFNSFEEFMYSIGPKPDGYSLDRKDNEGHYEPKNVRWSSRSMQQLNRRSKGVRKVSAKGLVTDTWQSFIHIDGKFFQLYCGPSYGLAVAARQRKLEEITNELE